MDESSLFMQWAMDTLQHEHRHPSPGGSAALRNGGMASSGNTSSAVVTENDSVGGSSSVSWNFASALAQQPGSNEATTAPSTRARDVPDPAASRRASAASTGRHTSPPARDHHIMAERKRREKINRRFIELSTVIPGLKKIEVAISESSVMVRIHCEDGKGRLVRLLAEVEGLHLSITHTNVIPFPACTVIITIVAKVDEGLKITTEDIVGKLESALRLKNLEAAKT